MNFQAALLLEHLDASLTVILVIGNWVSATVRLSSCFSSSFS